NCCWQKQSLVAVAALYMLHAANIAVFFNTLTVFRSAPPVKTRVFTRSGSFLRQEGELVLCIFHRRPITSVANDF
ncbi:MAG TPA: hypothetical protein VF854_00960, partial [Azonexus sp.]